MTDISVVLYKAEWCGYCMRFKPTWNKVMNLLKTDKMTKLLENENIKINFVEYDSESNRDVIIADGISSYPTIKITKKIGANHNSMLLDDNQRELNAFVRTIFDNQKVIDEINTEITNTNLSGGFFNYSTDEKLKYYKKYLKYKQKYITAKRNLK